MWSRWAAACLIAGLLFPGAAAAVDEEGCLICHRLDLHKASADGGTSLKVADPRIGSHEPLYCSDCHPDAKTAPHTDPPGPAGCVGACHGSTATATESHRRAAFGGLTEAHRRISAPRAPCLLCHAAPDAAGATGAIVRRCASCHSGELSSVSRGVHHRLRSYEGGGMCASCHPSHRTAGKGSVNCGGPGCHERVTAGMRRLGGHASGRPSGKSVAKGLEVAAFLSLAVLGGALGRLARRDAGTKGGRG